MSDIDARLACASAFILQSPPGEVNDVFNDVRALVGDDTALEQGILPALQKYNIEQLIVADLPDKTQLMICSSGSVQDDTSRYIEPSTAKAWTCDHLRLSASDPVEIQVDEECEAIRAELEKTAKQYSSEHFSDGVSKVFTTEQTRIKPVLITPEATEQVESIASSKPKVETSEQRETSDVSGALGEAVQEGTEHNASATVPPGPSSKLDDPETEGPGDESMTTDAATPAPATTETSVDPEASVDTDMVVERSESVEPAQGEVAPAANTTEKLDEASEIGRQEEGSTITQPEDVASTSELVEAEKAGPLPKKFSLYFVGNKYNPSNYWTGRWRSTYELDLSQGQPSLRGVIQINVHFFEQGNVQLATEYTPIITLPESLSDRSSAEDIAKAVLKTISKTEEEYQLELNESYRDMADRTFRNLRRVLPITRQKMDWAKVASYKIGRTLGSEQ